MEVHDERLHPLAIVHRSAARSLGLQPCSGPDAQAWRHPEGGILDTRAGANTPNHQDLHVDALIDRLLGAATDEAYLKAGHDLQQYVVAETMIYQSLTTLPFIQAELAKVKGYEQLNGFKVLFETMWLDR